MSEVITQTPKKKIVSFSQFSKWFTCPYQWYRDYILKEKTFEDNLIMSFGTAIHETVQEYLTLLFKKSKEDAQKMDYMEFFKKAFQAQIDLKKLPHTQPEVDDYTTDAENILKELFSPINIARLFSPSKFELLAIEDELNEGIVNNVNLNAHLDIVLRETATGNIRIVDLKTSTNGWNQYQKEDFTKISQLVLYKAMYSKKHNIPLSKIQIEFIILRRKLYDETKAKYPQTRVESFKPSSNQNNVIQVIQEFTKFVQTCFTNEGIYKEEQEYPKIPGKAKKNCKYCQYLKNGKCDAKATKTFVI